MDTSPALRVVFFRGDAGREPVREWLLGLEAADRKAIGEDIKVLQFRWPLGMPLVRKIEPGLWEIRSRLPGGRIARVFFTVGSGELILLHGFQKRSQATPQHELALARQRRDQWHSEA